MKRAFFICLLCIVSSTITLSQINVCGTVIDSDANTPLAKASVVIKGADGKIKKFTCTNADGSFSMQMPSGGGCRIEATMMGFAKQSLSLDSISFPLTIYLEAGATLLKEVTVKAERIREQGDTVTYNVGSFAQVQDRTIGDVLKRMPGIDVEDNGAIKYQGADINKFYIEGSDLLGGKYGVATSGISHSDVGAVEVMENHQPMQVLTGISFSDKAAINLKLKNKAKATWSFHGDAGGGWTWQPDGIVWDSELFAMAAMPKFQSMTTFRTNNTGENISSSKTDFLADQRVTGLNQYISLKLPETPSLDSRCTFFNRSFLVSNNNLWKIQHGELKANIDYSFNRVASMASNVTTYFLDEGNRTVIESRDGIEHEHSLSGKFIFELNQKTMFINNTLQTNIDWNDVRLNTISSISNVQSADLPDYYVSNKFKLIQRFKGNLIVTFKSRNEWESLPQTLRLNTSDKDYRQHIGDHAFYTQESTAYSFILKGITVSLEGGIKGYWRSMNSAMSYLPEQLPGITENVVHTNSMSVYATPKLEYWVKRINLTLNLPVSYVHYSFDKSIANRDEVYFSPSLSMNWKPNNRFSGNIRGSIGRSPMKLNLVHSGLIMADYRTLKSGVEDFYNTSSKSLSASFNYKHTRRGLFANGLVMYTWSHSPYTLAQQLYGYYVVYSYAKADNDSKTFMTMASLGKTLDFMHGSCNINGSFDRSESKLLSQQKAIQATSSTLNVGGKINGSPLSWFSFDYSVNYSNSCLTMNDASAPWLSSLTNRLSLIFTPQNKWLWQLSSEHYRNELSGGTFKTLVMLDTKLTFKASNIIELSASLTNILNKKHYNYTTYSQLSSFESQRSLRGCQLLLSIAIRK